MNSASFQISLKSTSTMSLDERFTMMLQNMQQPLTDIRDSFSQHLNASASFKNQRLVQQLAHRPSVQAALQNTWSVKQNQFQGSVKARLGRHSPRGGYGMSGFWGRSRGRVVLKRRASAQSLTNWSVIEGQHGPCISRAGLARGRGPRGVLRGHAGRGMLFVGHGSAERKGRPDCCHLPTREELDAELDEYMSMTKSELDAQLNAYMAEVDSKDLL